MEIFPKISKIFLPNFSGNISKNNKDSDFNFKLLIYRIIDIFSQVQTSVPTQDPKWVYTLYHHAPDDHTAIVYLLTFTKITYHWCALVVRIIIIIVAFLSRLRS